MTTISTEERRCALCGKLSPQALVLDANREGSADLDLRPPPEQRETIAHWVQECPHCGYCAPAIDEVTEGAEEALASPAYRALRTESRGSTLVVRLLCASTMLEHAHRLLEATETALWAAWAADDAGELEDAKRARRRTLDLLDELHRRGEHYLEDPNAETLVMIDVARRAGEFERAEGLLEELAEVDDPRFGALVVFQRERIRARDTERHTIAEASGV